MGRIIASSHCEDDAVQVAPGIRGFPRAARDVLQILFSSDVAEYAERTSLPEGARHADVQNASALYPAWQAARMEPIAAMRVEM